ncbi:MAG TPA: hypothetical protein VK447_07190, partial [Myxococcaceae bacterium]|nr:hypothetical protein [Myxococcaceae bacterium]
APATAKAAESSPPAAQAPAEPPATAKAAEPSTPAQAPAEAPATAKAAEPSTPAQAPAEAPATAKAAEPAPTPGTEPAPTAPPASAQPPTEPPAPPKPPAEPKVAPKPPAEPPPSRVTQDVPATPTPPRAPAVPKERYLKLASPGFATVNVDAKVASFFSDHFAQQLAFGGIQVITASEISALIGYERQKQLLGCSEDSTNCIAELGGALGADGIISGTVGRFGTTYQLNLKVLSTKDGSVLGVASRKVQTDEQLLEGLTETARQLAPELLRRTGTVPYKTAMANARDEPPPPPPADPYPRNLATIAIVSLADSFRGNLYLQVEYERALSQWIGVYASLEFIAAAAPNKRTDTTKETDIARLEAESAALAIGGRLYFEGRGARGFFLSPEIYVGNGRYAEIAFNGATVFERDGLGLRLGMMAGFSSLLFDRIPVSIGLGLGYNPRPAEGLWPEVFPLARLNVGYAF